MGRIRKHGDEEYRYSNLIGIIVVNNYDQLTSLRVLGDEFRGDHLESITNNSVSD